MIENKDEIRPYDGQRPYVFISYARADSEVVLEVVRLLNQHKYRVWYDLYGIDSGANWSETILQKINNCTAFVVFLSPNSVKSNHVRSEVSQAFEKDDAINFIPIWLSKPCSFEKLQYFLKGNQIAFNDSNKDQTPEELFAELDVAIPDSLRNSSNIVDGVLLETEDDIHDLILDETINKIGDGACKQRINLTKVEFSKTITSIGNEAFRGCSSLTSVHIPQEVKHIGDSAFRDCVSMKTLVIENDIEIGERAFENCASLESISLPNDLTEIYNGVFNSCKKLKQIILPKNLIAIGDSAFSSCTSLQEIVIPDNVSRIDDQVFVGCISLKNVILSNNISRIGKNVFKDCISLEKIELPANLRKIDPGCFRGCLSLKGIEIDSKNRHFKSMNGIMFNKNKSTLVCYPTCMEGNLYVIPDSVCVIEDWAFADAKNIKKVIIPDSVERIGEGAFYHCENLEEIEIPYSVDTIQDTAFRGCKNLKVVKIASTSFKDLGWGIFYGCQDVTVYCASAEVEERIDKMKIKHQRYIPD